VSVSRFTPHPQQILSLTLSRGVPQGALRFDAGFLFVASARSGSEADMVGEAIWASREGDT